MRYRLFLALTQYNLVSILAIACIGILLRFYNLSLKPLWYDELIAVTLSTLPVSDILVNLRKIEVHPPPYYLQLKLWMLFSTSDIWIKLNSLMWNIFALVSLFYTTRSIFGRRISIAASILFALSPFAVFYAQEARPYSLMMFLGIWGWYFTHRFLYNSQSWTIEFGLMASTLFFLYSHGAGFLLLPATSSYALLYLLDNFNRWRQLRRWSFLQLVIVILYIPWLLRARSVRMGHAAIPGWNDVTATLFTMIYGYGEITWLPDWMTWISLGLPGIVIWMLFWQKTLRNIFFSFVMIPIGFCIIISYAISPIWLPRTLAFIFPFWCIGLSLTFSKFFLHDFNLRNKLRFLPYVVYILFSILLLALSIHQTETFHWPWNIRYASKFVETNVRANDIIFIPDRRLFLAWSWYYVGPKSVNPLTTNYVLIANENVTIVSSPTISHFIIPGRTYWHIYRPNVDPSDFFSSTGKATRELSTDFHGLAVEKVRFSGG
jgi:mannosyltransferase